MLKDTVVFKEGFNRLSKNEQDYLKNLMQALLVIQKSGAPSLPDSSLRDKLSELGKPKRYPSHFAVKR